MNATQKTGFDRPHTIRVTFWVFSKVLKREFVNVELHRDLADANLRALALGWTITKVEPITGGSVKNPTLAGAAAILANSAVRVPVIASTRKGFAFDLVTPGGKVSITDQDARDLIRDLQAALAAKGAA